MTMVAMHAINSKKLNYLEKHYIVISRLTLKNANCDINAVARENLKQMLLHLDEVLDFITTNNLSFTEGLEKIVLEAINSLADFVRYYKPVFLYLMRRTLYLNGQKLLNLKLPLKAGNGVFKTLTS